MFINYWKKLDFSGKLYILSGFLLLISVAYLGKGFYYLLLDNQEGTIDLYLRWQEQQYFYHGHYPYFAREGSDLVIREIGPITSGGYLPWSFFSGVLFFPPISYPLTRLYHVFLNLISLSVLALFSYNLGKIYHKSYALFAMAATLAISSNCTTLKNGQYGLIINAFLIGCYIFIQKNKHSWAGLFLGIAMIKPNISAFYFLIPLSQKKLTSVLLFFLYLIFATVYILGITETNPLLMLINFSQQVSFFTAKGNSVVNLLLPLGIPGNYATLILGLVGIIICLSIFYFYRNYSLLTLFAIASVMGRMCFYHYDYDNLMLVFLLLAMLELTFKYPHKLNMIVLFIVGISLWIPPTAVTFFAFYQGKLQFIIWGLAAVYLLISQKYNKANFLK